MTISAVLLVLAFICFLLAALGVNVPRVQLGWLGLALTALASLVAGVDVVT